MPDWLEPMAATLTEDRFGGPDWVFERKFDGIRLLAYKRAASVQLYSRNRLLQQLPELARAIAALPVDEVILDGEVTWDGRSGYHVFDILWLNGRLVTPLPLEERRALLEALPFQPPMQRVAAPRRSGAVGAREARGLGRRHRQAAGLAVRASPVEALAEDEVRSVAGARGRAASPIRRARASAWARCSSATTKAAISCSPGRSAPASTRSSCSTCAAASTRWSCRSRRSPGHRPAPPARALGPPRDRGAGRLHRMDRARQAAPPPAARRPFRQRPAARLYEC